MKSKNFSLNSKAAPFFSSSGESLSSNGDRHLDTVGKDQEAGEAGPKPVTTNIENWLISWCKTWLTRANSPSLREAELSIWDPSIHYNKTYWFGHFKLQMKELDTHDKQRNTYKVSVNNVRDYDEPSLAPWNFWLASIQRSNGSGIYFACCKAQDVQTKRI